jgi:protein TonB
MHLDKAQAAHGWLRKTEVKDRSWWIAVVLSLLLHLMVLAMYLSRQGGIGEGIESAKETRMEVSLMTRPAAKPEAKQEPVAVQPEPKPAPEPKPQPPVKPQKKAPPPALSKPKPSPAKTAPPLEKPLQEFRDDFAGLSHGFTQADRTDKESKSSAGSGGLGLMPGSILNINPRIKYPHHALQRHMEGVVVVLIHIETDGSCGKVDLLKSSGYQELDDEVIGAVQHWRFKPPVRGGMAVRGSYKHTVIFGVDRVYTDDFERHWREVQVLPSS